MKSLLIIIWMALAMGGCVSIQPTAHPAELLAQHEFMDQEIDALRLGSIETEADATYRLIWHPWHQNIAAISAARVDGQLILTVTQTDGYGTYRVGEFKSQHTQSITSTEYKYIESSFEFLGTIKPQIELFDLKPVDGEIAICLHAPSFLLEARVGNMARSIFRHCKDDYSNVFEVARPLVDLAWEKFPEQMKNIDPAYVSVRRQKEQEEQSQK